MRIELGGDGKSTAVAGNRQARRWQEVDGGVDRNPASS
uniref:Uncharacterized protein n=1 Tax=Arundo donax TaxID=35708 RepID=A0A0A8YKH7_ARUDO